MVKIDGYISHSLKPKALQLLVAVDELRQISKVAAFMNITQSAVSKAIAEIERGLGVELFERTARGVQPTRYGECMIRHARIILGDLRKAHDELRDLRSGRWGTVRVGTLASAALELLPRGLAALKALQPNVTVTVHEGTIEALLPELWIGNLDLIVGRLPEPGLAGAINEKPLAEDGLNLVAGPHHVLARRKRVSWADLKGFAWVLPPENALLRRPLELALERHGITMPVNRIETLSLHVKQAYLAQTDAIAVVSEDVATYYESLGLLAILPLELPKLLRPVGVVWSKQRPLSPGAEELIGCLESTARPHASTTERQAVRKSLQGTPASAQPDSVAT
jgi:DNA-binding transcriptional LysR family regulator